MLLSDPGSRHGGRAANQRPKPTRHGADSRGIGHRPHSVSGVYLGHFGYPPPLPGRRAIIGSRCASGVFLHIEFTLSHVHRSYANSEVVRGSAFGSLGTYARRPVCRSAIHSLAFPISLTVLVARPRIPRSLALQPPVRGIFAGPVAE